MSSHIEQGDFPMRHAAGMLLVIAIFASACDSDATTQEFPAGAAGSTALPLAGAGSTAGVSAGTTPTAGTSATGRAGTGSPQPSAAGSTGTTTAGASAAGASAAGASAAGASGTGTVGAAGTTGTQDPRASLGAAEQGRRPRARQRWAALVQPAASPGSSSVPALRTAARSSSSGTPT